jgi:hypothetical protein
VLGVRPGFAGYPASWPSAGQWVAYTSTGIELEDPQAGAPDDSNGGASVNPSGVDAYGGDSGGLPSSYFSYSRTDQVAFFAMRLRGDPRASGGGAPLIANTWNGLFDLTGDGIAEFFIELNGNPDELNVYYTNGLQNAVDSNDCADGEGRVWTTSTSGTSLVTVGPGISVNDVHRVIDETATGGGYVLQGQVPLSAGTDCNGAPLISEDTPWSMVYTTSTTPQNPTLKDFVNSGDAFTMSAAGVLAFGDPIALNTGPSQNPLLVQIEATSCSDSNVGLSVAVMDALVMSAPTAPNSVVDTIDTVTFQYRVVGSPSASWTDIGLATAPTSPAFNPYTGIWDVSGIDDGAYLVRALMVDDQGNTGTSLSDSDFVRVDIDSGACTTAVTTPVTMSYFRARPVGYGVRFDWSTASETGNVGFNLYANPQDPPLNDELIRSSAVDSLERQDYRYEISYIPSKQFYLEDLDIRGRSTLHGPFEIGRAYGKRIASAPIDWQKIVREREPERARFLLRGRRGQEQAFGDVRLLVEADGVYRVTYEQLLDAGADIGSVSSKALALLNKGQPVPLHIEAGKDGRFGPGDYFEFVGKSVDTLYSGTNVYVLRADRRAAQRVTTVKRRPRGEPAVSYLEKVVVERNHAYSFAAPNGDPWYDTSFLAYGGPAGGDFSISVEDYDQASPLATELEVMLWGVTDWPQSPDHHVILELNGVEVADQWFDGLMDKPVRITLPAGIVVQGENLIGITLPGDAGVRWDMVNLESYALTYPRRLIARDGRIGFTIEANALRVGGLPSRDLSVYREAGEGLVRVERLEYESDPSGGWAVSLAGGEGAARYWISTADAMLSPGIEIPPPAADITNGDAQYLIIAHGDFIAALDDLILAREAEGLAVKVVDVADVYAAYSDGVFDARAIRDYIDYAQQRLGTEYVLLVGGDTYDYRDYLGLGSMSFIPSLYAQTDGIVKFAPVDPLYTDADRDGVPDLPIGRLPVRTQAELAVLLDKILAFDRKDYGETAVFSADGYDAAQDVSFSAVADEFAGQMPSDWEIQRAFVDELGVTGAKTALVQAINEGVALTSYVGHSAASVWSFQNVFTIDDAQALTNAGRPTVVSQWGCWNTYYVSPNNDTMAHKLLLSGDRGAAAVLGATTLTEASSEEMLGGYLLPLMAQPGTRIGDAIQQAKEAFAADHPEAADVILGWVLLGDPTQKVAP